MVGRAMNEWCINEPKSVYGCGVRVGARIQRADTNWLNCFEHQWEEYANNYWSGLASNNPFYEVLVHGAIYFPDWEQCGNA